MSASSEELINTLKTCTPNVYFQPMEDAKMTYPCITVVKRYSNQKHADNSNYSVHVAYWCTVIDTIPDSDIQAKVMSTIPMCRWENDFITGGLYHSVFTIYKRL